MNTATPSPPGTRPIVVVTGGAAGIGAELCQSFLTEGYEVICLDRNPPTTVDTHLHGFAVDLSNCDAVSAVAAAVASRFAISHLIHNAGSIRQKAIESVTPDDMAALSALHLAAPLLLLQAFLPAMTKSGNGRVILISSRAALGLANRTAYAATKAGMIGLGRTWALELAPKGITVNIIAPGPIGGTPMFEALVPPASTIEAKITASIPIGRLGHPTDIANAALFFASPRSSFITGQVLYVCGGSSVGTTPL